MAYGNKVVRDFHRIEMRHQRRLIEPTAITQPPTGIDNNQLPTVTIAINIQSGLFNLKWQPSLGASVGGLIEPRHDPLMMTGGCQSSKST